MKIVILTAPSGSGKTTIAARVMAAFPEMRFSVSATTRPPRPGEQHGIHYYFMTPDAFWTSVAAGDLLEYEEVYTDLHYGTLRSEVERLADNHPVLLDVEVKGALNIKKIFGHEAYAIFIQPPSLEVLRHRLVARGTEDEVTLRERLERAKMELDYAGCFDTTVVNDDLETAVHETIEHVRAFLEAESHA